MTISRRKFLLGLGLLAAGCSSSNQMSELPPPTWPGEASSSAAHGSAGYSGSYASATSPYSSRYAPVTTPGPRVNGAPHRPMETGSYTAQMGVNGGIHAIPRSRWAAAPPELSRIYAMNGVNRITNHHEGWTTVGFSDAVSTAQRLEEIRVSHLERLHAGDIAYHYIIDRAGRVWQGRDVRYQGAHVKYENEHNVGVMVLGNFELQEPTQAQLATLRQTIHQLMAEYRVPIHRVYTHRELGPTECPGRNLQPRVVAMRNHNFA